MAGVFANIATLFKREAAYRRPRPFSATLALTERCNLKCRSCGVWRQPARKEDELPLEDLRRILHELKGMGVETINLIEGEPLLNPDIVEIVQRIADLGMASHITTNAVLLRGDKAKHLVEAGLGAVDVSIDAPNEVHDQLRGAPGVFERARDGLRELATLRDQSGTGKPALYINSVLSQDTLEFLDDWLDFAADLGVNGINFISAAFVPAEVDQGNIIGGEKASSGKFMAFDQRLNIREDQVPAMVEKLKSIRKEGARRGIAVWISPDILLSTPKDFEAGIVPVKRCYTIRQSLIVGPYGEITPCAFMDKYAYGSALEQPLSEIWRNGKHQALMDAVDQGMDICRHCRCHFGSNLTPVQQIQRRIRSL